MVTCSLALDVDSPASLDILYLKGWVSQDKMESAGRAEGNLIDTLLAFREVDVTVSALMHYAETNEEIPFPKTIPAYPVRRGRRKVRRQAERLTGFGLD